MKKEVFLAITIGFVLGLIITFGIWTANKSLKQLPAITAKLTPTPITTLAPSPSQTTNQQPTTNNQQLTITSPVDESVTNSASTTVAGTTTPNAIVTIVYESAEQIVIADAKGAFSVTFDLDAGYNRILVTSFDTTGHATTQTLTVTFTTAKI